MGACSYCYKWQQDECFGWDQAKGLCGISGPNDPKRLKARIDYNRREAASLRKEAQKVRDEAKVKADTLERIAAVHEQMAVDDAEELERAANAA